MPVVEFGVEDALRVAEPATPRAPRADEQQQDADSAEWHKMQTSIASLQALGVLKDPGKRVRRQSLPAIPSQEKNRATTVPPDLNVEDVLETQDGLPRLGTAKMGMPAGMPTPPARTVLKSPDASKFMKMFEQNQSLQQAAETAPAGGFPGRRGRRWTVVANQVHNLGNIKPPEEDAKQTPAERSVNRNSVRLSNLPSGQRASTALPAGRQGGKVGNLDDLFDEEELSLQVGGSGNASSDAQAWKGWYKIKSKAKTADAAELEAAAFGARPTSILETLTTAPAEQTGASKEVIEAAGKWQAVCEETEAATEESINFANDLPPGMGKLAAMLVNRFGSLERAFYNFDYNRKGKITRGQWQTVFATVRIDVQEVTGIPQKKVFRMIAAFGESTSMLEISFDQWRLFFENELGGGECAFLCSEDRGSQAPKRWEKVKKIPGKALKALVEHVDEVEAASTALRRYISGEDVPPDDAGENPWSSSSEDSGDSSDGDGESSKGRRKGKRREEDGAQSDTSSDSDEGGSASHRSLKPATEDGNSASASSAVGDVQGDGDADNTASFEPSASKGDAETLPWPKDDSSDWGSSSDSDVAEGDAKKAAVKKSLGAHSGVDARRVNRDKVMKALVERDDTALAQLNDDELQALAEQVQLQEEIEQFDLSSIDAFAYVLLAKMGSFKRAFNWFDFNCSKKITNVTWDTGILLLHVDTEKLTGLKPSNIFYRMDTCTEDPPTGMITRKKWKQFFSGFQIPEELKKQLEEGRSLRKRAAARAKQYRRRGSLFRGDRGQRLAVQRRDSEEEEVEETEEERQQRLAEEQENYRAWVERELSSIADGDYKDFSDAVFRGGAESLLNPFRRRQIMMEIAEVYGLYTLSAAGIGRMPPRNSKSLERAPGVLESGIMPEPGCMRIYNMKSFSGIMIDKFETMRSGGRLVVNDMAFTEAQKAVAHLLALDRTLVAVFEKWGAGERLVVHHTGSFASGVNSQLDALHEGDAVTLDANLSKIEMRYVQAQAAKMGMTVVRQKNDKGEETLKVFNMNEFANTVREKLADVGVGNRAVFKNLCIQERQVVHSVAVEMGLHSMDGEEGDDLKNVIVFSDVEFQAKQAARMSQAADGGSGNFILPQTAQQQKDFWAMADKNGLSLDTSFHGSGKSRFDFKGGDVVHLATVKSRSGSSASDGDACDQKPGPAGSGLRLGSVERATEATAEETSEGIDVDIQKSATIASPTIETSSELIRQAFDAYASGNSRGERIFLRYVDLKEFASDLRSAMPGRRNSFRDFNIILELCFDDTTQLQSDFGLRVGPGLTHQFFQVFIQKAMTRLGLQVASVLFEILNEHS